MAEVLSDDVQPRDLIVPNDNAKPAKTKHKKRSREAEPEGHLADEQVKPKKKKKSRDVAESVAVPQMHAPGNVAETAPVLDEVVEKRAKKKKKKDKGKERAAPPEQAAEGSSTGQLRTPAAEDSLEATSADFISAVVAAASATSHLQEPVPPGYPPQPIPPYPPYHDHLAQYPPTEYPYPPLPPPYGPPGMYPDLHTILPDLNLASSEELLRTLQDMDKTMLASVLKTLSEAGVPAGANGPLNIQPSFVPPPAPPGPPPVNQVSAKSVAILGRDPKQAKEFGTSTRTLPPPRHVSPPRPPEEDNPDHAYMLANVWMNASKLAEMVRTQGMQPRSVTALVDLTFIQAWSTRRASSLR